jgi:tetratricopeptide (TPR) repeat protein
VRYLPLGPSLFILAVAAGLLGWWSVKDRRVLFAAGFLAATILPVCNLVPIYHPVADRYLYNPLIAGALLLAIALDSAWISAVFARRLAVIIGLLIVAALLVPVTLERERVWSDDILLWQDTLARNPDSVGARANLPGAYLEEGRLEEAKVESERALNTPGFVSAFAWADYAIVLNRLGDRPGALAAARRAIALQPDIVDADKMVETLQAPRDLSDEFARLAASAPASGK